MSGPHTFHNTVLREYDIRGIVGDTLTPNDARAVAAMPNRRCSGHAQ